MHHLDNIDFQLQYGGIYILVRLWVELFVSQAFFRLFDWHRLICCNVLCFSWKTLTWSKGNKDGNSPPPPHNFFLIIVLQCSGREFLHYSLAVQGSKSQTWLCPHKISESFASQYSIKAAVTLFFYHIAKILPTSCF